MSKDAVAITSQVKDLLRTFQERLEHGKAADVEVSHTMWQDMSTRMFSNSSWPTAREIAPFVREDKKFLTLYRVLFFNHLLLKMPSKEQPATLEQYVQSWEAYSEFLQLAADESTAKGFELPQALIYEILSSILFLYNAYHAQLALLSGNKEAGVEVDTEEVGTALLTSAPDRKSLSDEVLLRAWTLPDLLSYFTIIVERSGIVAYLDASSAQPTGFVKLAGYFALLCLARMYTCLGDYATALEVMRPVGLLSGDAFLALVPRAHIAAIHSYAFALVMSRRYEDALRMLNRTLPYFMRSHSLFQEREASRHVRRIRVYGERIIPLLTLCQALAPNVQTDDMVRRAFRDANRERLERLARGEGAEDVADIFSKTGIKFWSFTATPLPDSPPAVREAYISPKRVSDAHLRRLKEDAELRARGLGKMRSYMSLYTAISVPKLAAYAGMTTHEVLSLLVAQKIKSWAPPLSAETGAGAAAMGPSSGTAVTDALHYFLSADNITIEEAKQTSSVSGTFVRGIKQVTSLVRDAPAGGAKFAARTAGGAPPSGARGGAPPATAGRTAPDAKRGAGY